MKQKKPIAKEILEKFTCKMFSSMFEHKGFVYATDRYKLMKIPKNLCSLPTVEGVPECMPDNYTFEKHFFEKQKPESIHNLSLTFLKKRTKRPILNEGMSLVELYDKYYALCLIKDLISVMMDQGANSIEYYIIDGIGYFTFGDICIIIIETIKH